MQAAGAGTIQGNLYDVLRPFPHRRREHVLAERHVGDEDVSVALKTAIGKPFRQAVGNRSVAARVHVTSVDRRARQHLEESIRARQSTSLFESARRIVSATILLPSSL